MAEFDFTISDIESAIDCCLRRNSGVPISAETVVKQLGGRKTRALSERIDRVLAGDDRFFDDGKGHFTSRAAFFRNYEFILTPDEWEIQEGILFPGHRFAAYVSPSVFPSETRLRDPEGKPFPERQITAPISQIFHYHILLGSEQLFDFFTAESAANAHLSRQLRQDFPVTLNVFDLMDFYREHQFAIGDALLCRVTDWETGQVVVSPLPADERKESDRKQWIAAYEKALEPVFSRFESYAEIPEQLSYACFTGAGELPAAEKSASLDEFVRRTGQVEIRFDSDHTVLAKRQAEADDEPAGLPEGVLFSRGETGEIGALLREIGSPLTPIEIDSYILDCCYARELDFEDFFARAFGREKLKFVDEGQQAVFYNHIEERFEELTETYNRVDDEPKAPLRSTILELVDDRLAFFDFLESLGKSASELPKDGMKELAALSAQLDEILKFLNDPGYTPEPGELDRLEETVELRTDEAEALLSRLTDHFESRPHP